MANCDLVAPPKLNPEVLLSMTDQHKARDSRLANMQNCLGASITAIGKALTILLKEEGGGENNIQLIEWLSDAGRLLTNAHHSQTESRKILVSADLNKNYKDTLTNASVDGWLFGENLTERVKAAKALERSSADLKPAKTHTKTPNKKNLPQKGKHLNSKSLPRYSALAPRRQNPGRQNQMTRNQPKYSYSRTDRRHRSQ